MNKKTLDIIFYASIILLCIFLASCNTVPKKLEGTNNTVKKEETKLEALDKFWRLLRPVRILTTGISK